MDMAAIDALALEAQQNNDRDGITGILVATGELFFQIIEGPDALVDALFSRIASDSRHRQVMILSVEQGELTRLCPDWAMRKVDLSAASIQGAEPVRTLLRMAWVQRQLVDEAVASLEAYTLRTFIDAEQEAISPATGSVKRE